MSPKALIIASMILGSSTAVAVPALAASKDAQDGQPPIRAAIMFNMLDQNGDGSIDSTEIQSLTSAIIEAVDTDGNGALSEAELQQVMKGLTGQRGGRHAGRGPQRQGKFQRGPRGGGDERHQRFGRGGRGGPDGEQRMARFAERLGIDSDGLTQQEFLDKQTERFASVDANGDGIVTLEEFAAAGPRMRGLAPSK